MAWKALSSFEITEEEFLELAKECDNWLPDMEPVIKCIFRNREFSPKVNMGTEKYVSSYVQRWVNKFEGGYNNRPSQRTSNPISTHHDKILDYIVQGRINNIEDKELDKIVDAHRLMMAAENIAGIFLEEYIAVNLRSKDWYCCWGESMKSIDFCNNKENKMLQIKNSDNSENSSSSKVRKGTEIEHWFRRFSRTGETNWEDLNIKLGLVGDEKLTEEAFKRFVITTIQENPNALYIEPDNSWDPSDNDQPSLFK